MLNFKRKIDKASFIFFLFLFSFFLFSSCRKSTEPLYNPQTLQLTVADVSCTEAWLKLKAQIAQNDSSDLKLQLYRNDNLIVSKPFTSTDSLLYVYGLQPATTYSFSAKVLKNGKLQATGNRLPVTTMDTTSHNFTWQTFEFGGVNGSSYFKDVAIIDENDIWAVGEIHTKDTDHWNEDSTKWLQPYNAAHWDGEKWELKRIPFVDRNGYAWVTPLYSIWAFSKNDIWFEGGVYWNGNRFVSLRKNINFPSHVNKIWGTSDNNLYIVGNKGLIAHYDGKQWQRIESGTDLNFYDIWGDGCDIICTASNVFFGYNSKIILITKNKVNTLPSLPNFRGTLSTVWFKNKFYYFFGGDGVFIWDNILKKWIYQYQKISSFYIFGIRGSGFNNIFAVGGYGDVLHFNGKTWKSYFVKTHIDGNYVNLSVKDNLIAIVGDTGSRAVITIGKKL